MKTELPIYLEIKKVVNESKDIKTLIFERNLDSSPGQFVNVWLPRVNEKPYSISFQDKNRFAITIFAIGPFSKKLHELKQGDKVGIRGPYGNGFVLRGERIALVGGGCGAAPLAFLADEAVKKNIQVDFIIGARNKDLIIFKKRFERSKVNLKICTDDGSEGFKGFTTELLEESLKKDQIDCIYACGPEIMLKKVIDISDRYNTACQVSLERYMKCGFGVCGQCCVDPIGICICKEGPVLPKNIARQITELGKYKRDAAGAKVRI